MYKIITILLFAPALLAVSEFQVSMKETVKTKVGEKGTIVIEATPTSAMKINVEAPSKLELKSCKGIELEKSAFNKSDSKKNEAKLLRFETSYSAKLPGKCQIDADLSFYLCSPEICKKVDSKNTLNIQIDPSELGLPPNKSKKSLL